MSRKYCILIPLFLISSVFAVIDRVWTNGNGDRDYARGSNWYGLSDGYVFTSNDRPYVDMSGDDAAILNSTVNCQSIFLGSSSGATGELYITGGESTFVSCVLGFVANSSGYMYINGGQTRFSGFLTVPIGGFGRFEMSDGGISVNRAQIAQNAGTIGRWEISGGQFSSDTYLIVGNGGVGEVVLTGGTMSLGSYLYVGSNNLGSITMTGGTIDIGSNLQLGVTALGSGRIEISGTAQLNAHNGDTFIGKEGNAELIMNGGVFNAYNVYCAVAVNSTSNITVAEDARLNVENLLFLSDGATLKIIGSGSSVQAGKLVVENGANIIFELNRTDGAGDGIVVSGDVILNGTVSPNIIGGHAEGTYTLIRTSGNIEINNPRIIDMPYVNYEVVEDGGFKELRVIFFTPNSCSEVINNGFGLVGDLNNDCRIGIADFALMASGWLICNDPADPACDLFDGFRRINTPLAEDFKVLFKTYDPQTTYIYDPGVAVCPNGRIIGCFNLGGSGASSYPPAKGSGNGRVYTCDDDGDNWTYRTNFPIAHFRPFVAGERLYILGHADNLRIIASDDWGDTWSEPVDLTVNQTWHGSATNVWYKDNFVYLVMERRMGGLRTPEGAESTPDMMQSGWPVSELAPVLLRGDTTKDLTKRENWTFASEVYYAELVNDTELDWFGVPYYDGFYPEVNRDFGGQGSFSPVGWLEANVVHIKDPKHYLYDSTGKTFHIFLRAHTGITNLACMIKAVEQDDGAIQTMLETVPSGKNHLYVPLPGGHLKFSVVYDEQTQLYWMVGTQSTDSTIRPELIPDQRYGLGDNERRRLVLHFSKNMIDWCFAGVVSIGPAEYASRNYPNMVIKGENLLIMSRSGDLDAKNAHDGNIATFHKVKNFRDLVY